MSEITLLPKVHTAYVHTSNVINWSNMKKNPLSTTTSEILYYSKALCKCWKSSQDERSLQYMDTIKVECGKHKDIISDDERDEIRVTAKLWLCSWDKKVFHEAFKKSLEFLNVTDIDTLLLVFPVHEPSHSSHNGTTNGFSASSNEDSHFSAEEQNYMAAVMNIWQDVEQLFIDKLTHRVGVCDFPLNRLHYLYDKSQVKPMINQLYVNNSCHIPEEMVTFAQDKHIQLLVHHDDADILPSGEIQAVFGEVFSPGDGRQWRPEWVLSYHSLYKMRGIIRAKGYAYKLHRDLGAKPSM